MGIELDAYTKHIVNIFVVLVGLALGVWGLVVFVVADISNRKIEPPHILAAETSQVLGVQDQINIEDFNKYIYVDDNGVAHLKPVVLKDEESGPRSKVVVLFNDKRSRLKYQYEKRLYNYKVSYIRALFEMYKAPLYEHAESFVKAADKWGLDYRLMPAISIVESSGGRYLFKPYNPFGWGQASFKSFDHAIFYVAERLRKYYYDLGWVKPQVIAYKYNGPTPEAWGRKVSYLMSLMPSEEQLKEQVRSELGITPGMGID